MYRVMLNMHENIKNELITGFFHNHPNYTIDFVNSKEIPTNCSEIERNTLWICDTDNAIAELNRLYSHHRTPDKDRLNAHRLNALPIPVIAFSHPGNTEESLMGAPFLILSAEALTPSLIEEVICRSSNTPITITKTRRLLIRELTLCELPWLLELSEENKNNPGGSFFPENCAAPDVFLREYIRHQYGFYRFGLFGVFAKNSDDFLGIAGFSPTEIPGADAEVSYALLNRHQHLGYAKEALKALLLIAGKRWQLDHLAAVISDHNHSSIKLAKTLGIRTVSITA